jgi:metallo-beta-lactamase family protein
MKLTFYGGAGSVTGACSLVETKTTKILVDCGLIQGGYVAEKINYQKFPFDPKEIDYVFITHGHLDHVGRAPKLYKDGFRGLIFATYPTCDFSELILYDSQNILSREAKAMRRKPIYSEEDVRKVSELFHGVEYGEEIKINNNLTFKFRDAGHILGSGIIEIWLENKKLVFSGDLGNTTSTLLRPTEIIDKADYIIMESLYGDRAHENKKERKIALERAIEDATAKGGVIMIPAFAIERTQELLYELNELVENKRIPRIPMFLDSPLSIEATAIYKKYPQYYGGEAKKLIKSGDALFDFPGLKLTRTKTESIMINDVAPPKVIIAGSGMLEGGRIWHHLKRYLSDPKSLLLIISYQAPGSLGRKILDGAENVRVFNNNISVKANIMKIDGYSAHADRDQLISFVANAKKGLKKVFMVQGEEESSQSLATVVQDRLGVSAVVPKIGDSYEL